MDDNKKIDEEEEVVEEKSSKKSSKPKRDGEVEELKQKVTELEGQFLRSVADYRNLEKRVDEDRGYLQNELSVKFKASVSKEEISSILSQHNSKIIKEITMI